MKRAIVCVAGLGLAAAAQAQYSSGFEPGQGYTGAPGGVSVVGQDGWTSSPTQPSNPHLVYNYAGNTLGIAANPNGRSQFLGGASAGATLARAQHDVNWGASNQWVISYDLCPLYSGTLPAAANLASTSDQRNDLAATRQFIALKNWVDNNNPVAGGWKSEFNVFNDLGGALNNQIAFTGMAHNQWYRESIFVDFTTNQITKVTMKDLTTNVTQTFIPPGWYLTGGASPVNPMPDAFRFFVGGSLGQTMGWDRLNIAPTPGALAIFGLAGLAAARRRR
jgi:hypothetical protein